MPDRRHQTNNLCVNFVNKLVACCVKDFFCAPFVESKVAISTDALCIFSNGVSLDRGTSAEVMP